MRAIVFGQSGLGKSDYLDAVSGVARTRGRTLKCISLGRRMHEIDPHKQPADKYPSLPVSHRVLLRQQAMQSILSEVERQPNNDYLIIAHAVFRLDTGSAPAYDLELFKQFRPDTVVVLIDDFHHVHRNLQGTEYRGLSLHEVLEWRDAEITSAKAIAENLLLRTSGNEGGTSWPFYVLPRGHDPEVMYRLLYEAQDRLKVYCSFPITSATEQQKKDVNNFKAELTQKHIAFDPLKIGERSVVTYADAVLEEIAERARADEAVSTEYAQLVAALKNCAGSVEEIGRAHV